MPIAAGPRDKTTRGVSWQKRPLDSSSCRSLQARRIRRPPVGTALGPQGINIMAFCKEFNARTQGQDTILPVEITIFADKSFTFITKTPPAAVLLKKEAGSRRGPDSRTATRWDL